MWKLKLCRPVLSLISFWCVSNDSEGDFSRTTIRQALKTLKVRNYSNFMITFPTISRCAVDFFKALLKLKMAAMDELHLFLVVKTPKLKSEIIHILQSHYPPSGNVQVILLKFKMATTTF